MTSHAHPPDVDLYRGYIEDALAYAGGTHLYEDIVAGVASGDMQFWPGPNSAIITEIQVTPRRKLLNFFLAGGNLQELEVMVAAIEPWAKERGCDGMTSTARRGWARTFLTKDAGWSEMKMAVFLKDFSHGQG